MTNSIGKKINIGFGKEAVRGTAVTPSIRIPKGSFDGDVKVNPIMDESAIGVIEDAFEEHITKKRFEGSVELNIYVNSIGELLLATFGTVASAGTDPYTHTFTVENSNSHQSLTLFEANEVQDKQYPLCVVDTLSITASIDDFVKLNFGIKSKLPEDTALTPTFSTDYPLISKDVNIKFAETKALLSGATAICCKSLEISISKNIEEDMCLGSIEPKDFNNKMFTIEGSFEVNLTDEIYLDYVLDATKKAMEVEIANTSVDLGGGENPTLKFTFAKVAFIEIARAQGNDEVVKATLNFKALYSMVGAEMVEVQLINTTDSY